MDIARFTRHPLTFGPSPVEPLPRLSAFLGGRVEIWAKRDDCNSGIAFGGNKTRKLEYLVPDALAQGCDTLVSIGGVQSNHTRQVAAVAAKVGLKCHLVQGSWVDWPDAVYDRVGNIQLSRLTGASLRFSDEAFGIELKDSWQRALDEVRRAGGKPYAIPAGASDHPLGGLGYVRFAEELRAQERDLGFGFDYIVVGSGTGGTQAGMVVGFKEDGRAARVIGIDVIAQPEAAPGPPGLRSPGSLSERPIWSASGRPSRRPTSRSTPTMPVRSTACRRGRPWRRSGSPRAWRASSRTPSTRANACRL